jgi:hypothetical protein
MQVGKLGERIDILWVVNKVLADELLGLVELPCDHEPIGLGAGLGRRCRQRLLRAGCWLSERGDADAAAAGDESQNQGKR